MVTRLPMMNGLLARWPSTILSAVVARAQELRHGRLAAFRELDEEPQGRQVGGELVIVEQDPAPDFTALVITLGTVLARELGEVVEDDAGLRQPDTAMQQDGNLAHFIHGRTILGRARLAVEEINPHRLPWQPAQFEHECRLVGITRLGEAMELEVRHLRLSPV